MMNDKINEEEICKDFLTEEFSITRLMKKYHLGFYSIKNILIKFIEYEKLKLIISKQTINYKKSKKKKEWVKKQQSMHPICKCGCGNEIKILPQHYYTGIPKFIKGHSFRNNQLRKNKLLHPIEIDKIAEDFKNGMNIIHLVKKYNYSNAVLKRELARKIGNEKFNKIIHERKIKRAIVNSKNISQKILNKNQTTALIEDFKKGIFFSELEKKYNSCDEVLRRILTENMGENIYNSFIKIRRQNNYKKNFDSDYWEKWRKRRAEYLWDLEDDFDWNLIYTNLDRFEEVELDEESIVIDSNERNEYINSNLKGIKKRLWICDYYIYGHPHVIIERKTANDLYSSLLDGRLWNQLKTMQIFPSYPTMIFPAILLEGSWDDLNWRAKKHFKKWQFKNLLNIIQFKWQTAIIYSENEKDTVSILKAIQYAVKPKNKPRKQFYITPIKKKDKSLTEIRIAILMILEGVGETTAIKLLQKYGTIGNMLEASKTPDGDKILESMNKLYY